ncbi:hypothetical protein [Streptomyces sp. NBRC 109706]|uniref:hypothetical protein n=1 Tax=Streptomyces sp. NBRC 109706 TaxID=1550035 RepID=UPI00078224C4|nr:hypothetical protein [Streptomyces sp. NBRC 109706]
MAAAHSCVRRIAFYEEYGLFNDLGVLLVQDVVERARTFGPDHPETLTIRRIHASARTEIGLYRDVPALLRNLISDYERVAGLTIRTFCVSDSTAP